MVAQRRKRKGKIQVLVREKKRKKRKPRTYWRTKRPKVTKKGIKTSNTYVLSRIKRDKFGRIYGQEVVKSWKGRK